MQHLDEGTIHAWLDGALEGEEATRVEQHAAECGECAAGIAEARGFAAGASRILASLDNVPAGVIPRSSAAGESQFTARRSRPLWNVLHLTPARAAAAAVVFVAAGAALVVRHKADAPNRSPIVFATFDTTHRVRGAATTSPVIASAPPTAALPPAKAAPVLGGRKAKPHREAPMEAVVATSGSVSDSMSVAGTPRLTTESANSAIAVPAQAPKALDAAKSALAEGAGAAPRTALRPMEVMSARAKAAPSRASAALPAGCYSIDGDSLPMLPRRIVLDTSNADGGEGRTISGVARGAVTPVTSWHWSSRPGGVRLEMVTPSSASIPFDSISSAGDLRGVATLNGRNLHVLLRRVDCPMSR
jgi:hypothetical protein